MERERERPEMATGKVVVEKIRGRSTATSCFSKYPLKFILPTKVLSIYFNADSYSEFHLLKFPTVKEDIELSGSSCRN